MTVQYVKKNDDGEMDKKHRGSWAEVVAVAWLLSYGYDVFRNESQHGLADIVAVDFETGETILIDVKFASRNQWRLADGTIKTGGYTASSLSQEQKDAGVVLLYVFQDASAGFELPSN